MSIMRNGTDYIKLIQVYGLSYAIIIILTQMYFIINFVNYDGLIAINLHFILRDAFKF